VTAIPVSVVVVSRGRPHDLRRCLLGLSQLVYPAFEIVVVADTAGLQGVKAAGLFGAVKTVAFDTPNISTARNLGIAQAAGEIIAFLDDDAVPEPTWLSYLIAPFDDPALAAAGGFVRGRDGITFQFKGADLDALGRETPFADTVTAPVIRRTGPGDGVKTEGTNCAFRADVLRAMGGFDPAFHYFNDETDVNLRLARDGARVATVPLAQVHHGVAASDRRTESRAPRTLFDVGASSAVLWRKHAPEADRALVLKDLVAAHRRRLVRHMVRGGCVPGDVDRLLATLCDGWAEGETRPIAELPRIGPSKSPFLPYRPQPGFTGMEVVAGRVFRAARHRRRAEALVRSGRRVSLFLFSPTLLYHRVRFTDRGVWEQRGGLFGRADRDQPLFRIVGFRRRLAEERRRLREIRGLP